MDGLKDRVAIVTGGSRGIGRAIVKELASNGVKVAFNYLKSKDLAEGLVDEIKKAGGDAVTLQGDVKSSEFCKKLVDETKSKYGRIDFLVNNAGILKDKTLMMMADSDWSDVIETNLNSIFYLTRQVIVSFLKQKSGVVLNISSTAGIMGSAGQSNYSASKAGIIGFSKALAREVAAYGVRVNVLAPGFIDTEMVQTIHENKKKDLLNQVPMKRTGRVEEVSKVAAFLLSDNASYITGHVIPVDGGLAI